MKAQLAVDDLDEYEAMDIVHHLKAKFGWSVTIFTVEDCWVQYNGMTYTIGESEGEVTDEMKDAIRNDRGFEKWLDESLSESGNRQLPTLVIGSEDEYHIQW